MSLKKSLRQIRKFLLEKYGSNLAAILIFGSANTGQWREGISDIDSIILLKDKGELNLNDELKTIFNKMRDFNLSIVHFKSIKEYKEHIYEKGSWASWITIIDGSKKLYLTKEFKDFRKELIKKPISKENLKHYLALKDNFELYGYIPKNNGFDLTKSMMAHLRRKLQLINYFNTGEIKFDYLICLKNSNLKGTKKEKLRELYQKYGRREPLSKEEAKYYADLAKQFSEIIFK